MLGPADCGPVPARRPPLRAGPAAEVDSRRANARMRVLWPPPPDRPTRRAEQSQTTVTTTTTTRLARSSRAGYDKAKGEPAIEMSPQTMGSAESAASGSARPADCLLAALRHACGGEKHGERAANLGSTL